MSGTGTLLSICGRQRHIQRLRDCDKPLSQITLTMETRGFLAASRELAQDAL